MPGHPPGVVTIVATLASAALGLRLAVAWQDAPTLMAKVLPDDAFYYFGVARHIVEGHGPTFDGIHATNGFHPLWMAFLLPIYAVVPGDTLAVHVALTLCALFGATSVVLIFFAAHALTSRQDLAVVAAGVVALHPQLLMRSMNGLETSLALMLFSLVLLIYVRVHRRAWNGRPALAGAGGSAGSAGAGPHRPSAGRRRGRPCVVLRPGIKGARPRRRDHDGGGRAGAQPLAAVEPDHLRDDRAGQR